MCLLSFSKCTSLNFYTGGINSHEESVPLDESMSRIRQQVVNNFIKYPLWEWSRILFKINTLWDMADSIPYMVPTQFQDSIFPPITRPKIRGQNTPITPSTPPPPSPSHRQQLHTVQYNLKCMKIISITILNSWISVQMPLIRLCNKIHLSGLDSKTGVLPAQKRMHIKPYFILLYVMPSMNNLTKPRSVWSTSWAPFAGNFKENCASH